MLATAHPAPTRRAVLRLALALGVLAAALLAAPASASAASCNPTLIDGEGFEWDLFGELGGVLDGGRQGSTQLADAWDGSFVLRVAGESGYTVQYQAEPDSCGREEVGQGEDREVTFPARSGYQPSDGEFVSFRGLEVSRKFYSPASGPAFGRWLNILHNPTTAPITTEVVLPIYWGSSDTVYQATSSGDQTFAVGDRWATHSAGPGDVNENTGEPQPDVPLASLFDAASDESLDRFDHLDGDFSDGDGAMHYYDVTVPAGGTVILMNVEAQRADVQETLRFARIHRKGSEELYAGISPEERSQLINWPAQPPPTDGDLDGTADGVDNCPGTANGSQADLDRDGRGDACDEDEDGDGLSNQVEADVGSDPRDTDSDDDGRRDGADACVTLAGGQANGCPADPPECRGRDATMVARPGTPTTGTAGRDVIVGTPGPDVLLGGAGPDFLCGRGGDDRVRGASGLDRLLGQPGADDLRGEGGPDRLWGGADTDGLAGGPGRDVCLGGGGRDATSSCER